MNKDFQHLNKLREIHQKRLRILQRQAAQYGDLAVPTHIEIEIEELKIKILNIDTQLIGVKIPEVYPSLDGQDYLVNLRLKLISHFNLEELRTLCFDLGIDADNFPPLKEGFSRELINYALRAVKIFELVNYCKKKRPNVS